MKKIKIGIFGPYGRMGSDLIEQIKMFDSMELSSLCERKKHKMVGKEIDKVLVQDNIENLINDSDVIIDFTSPQATIELLRTLKRINAKTAIVTGTTGYSSGEEKKFKSLVKGITILRSFNMSIGINLLKNLTKLTSKIIGSESDIEILETHHNKKRDIPSGTSLSLADSVSEGNPNIKKHSFREKNNNRVRQKSEIGFSSIRGGDVVGEHTVYFFLNGERIELKHIATGRKIFSIGALEAANWIFKKKPGLYTIMDMVKI